MMRIALATIAGALILAAGSAQAQRRSEADYAQGVQQSALAFAAQSQWRGATPTIATSPAVGRQAACTTNHHSIPGMVIARSTSGLGGADQRRHPR